MIESIRVDEYRRWYFVLAFEMPERTNRALCLGFSRVETLLMSMPSIKELSVSANWTSTGAKESVDALSRLPQPQRKKASAKLAKMANLEWFIMGC